MLKHGGNRKTSEISEFTLLIEELKRKSTRKLTQNSLKGVSEKLLKDTPTSLQSAHSTTSLQSPNP